MKGWLGPGLSFDGLDNYVDFGTDSSMKPASAITVLSRVYIDLALTTAHMDNYARIVDVADGIRLWYTPDNKRIIVSPRLTIAGTSSVGYTVPATGWYDIAFIFNGTSYAYYINSVLKNLVSMDADTIDYNLTTIYVGGRGVELSFEGIIDEVLIFDEVLTAAQIRQHHQGYR